MKHLGDITKINGAEVEPVDIIVGGSPCQDLSVAGLRAGLAGARSGLFMEQIRIIKEMRENDRLQNQRTDKFVRPRYMVWENVPGAFSSNKGEDFRAVLEETAKIADENATIPRPAKGKWTHAGCIVGDGWSIAWRLHDAQFWGVPQRRKRISLVADFAGESAAEILFERESVSRDTEPCIKEGQEAAGAVEDGFRKTGEYADAYTLKIRGGVEIDSAGKKAGKGALIQTELSGTLGVSQDQTLICKEPLSTDGRNYIVEAHGFPLGFRAENTRCYNEKATTLCNGTRAGFTTGVIIKQAEGVDVYNMQSTGDVGRTLTTPSGGLNEHIPVIIEKLESKAVESHAQDARYNIGTINQTVSSNMEHDPANGGLVMAVENHPNDSRVKISEDGMVQTLSGRMDTGGGNVPLVLFDAYQHHGWRESDTCGTLTAGQNESIRGDTPLVFGESSFGTYAQDSVTSLRAKGGAVGDGGENLVIDSYVVRRLTPLECERLQGFPDGWTDIGDWIDSKGKKHKGEADAPRYKALGNSIALPFWQWMAARMVAQLDTDNPTMASLFDGIGGFPLVYSRCGCRPVWASEIEEFPIAVTKRRFPDD